MLPRPQGQPAEGANEDDRFPEQIQTICAGAMMLVAAALTAMAGQAGAERGSMGI